MSHKVQKAKARQRHNRRVNNLRKNNVGHFAGLFTTGEMRRGMHLDRHRFLVEQRRKQQSY